jgi:hypothetical protein
MSDYLNNLVARTLNLAPVVQPRLASLFEPSSFKGSMDPVSIDTETARDDRSRHELTSRVASLNLSPSQFTQEQLPVAPTEAEGFERTLTGVRRTSENRQPAEQATASSQTLHAIPVRIRLLAHDNPGARTDDATSAATENDDPKSKTAIARTTQIAAKQLPHPRPSQAKVRDLVEFASQPAGQSIIANSPEHADKPLIASAPRVNARSVAPVEQPPTISVTIGRVDVRAIFAPSPAPRASRTQPAAMSLDEYLKRRSEGRR